MYNINDTIIAVSGGQTPAVKKIVRISGDKTFEILQNLIEKTPPLRERKTIPAAMKISADFSVQASLYVFVCPNSYTGEDLVEIHLFACDEIIEILLCKVLDAGGRIAQAGEFTYRAYLNAKMDISQAEAVSQIVSSSNQYQLCAAQKLFSGSLEQEIGEIRNNILELLSLTEAGLDFADEDIELITKKTAIEKAEKIKHSLDELLAGSITFEQIAGAPSAVVTGSPNAGKSCLVNSLIGSARSIVSAQPGTTRDCLQHWLRLKNCDCILFDCAGLVSEPVDIIQTLANTAAIKAVNDAMIIIFCADITKQDYSDDLEILNCLGKDPAVFLATKCDLLTDSRTEEKLKELKKTFGSYFSAVSANKSIGLEKLKDTIRDKIISHSEGAAEAADKTALAARHIQAVSDAIKNIENARSELKNNNEEITAMFLRDALQELAGFQSQHIDEAILDNIFSRFCIGK
ncbi:MAG: GTP-binding protein [Phycisphaerae bacterium]|nr:GTP-binding protein [Phycisphaerae bacterium]